MSRTISYSLVLLMLAPLRVHPQDAPRLSNNRATPSPVFVGLSLVPFSSGKPMPEPESGSLEHGVYRNSYFDLAYQLPDGWVETYKGPPPSSTGYYVLAQLKPDGASGFKGTISISASDMFFLLQPAANTRELLRNLSLGLPAVMTIERPPSEVVAGTHRFVRMDYTGAGIHWSVWATESRCHALQFSFVSRDTGLIDKLAASLARLEMPAFGEQFPSCRIGYASGEHITHKTDPALAGPKFTSVPVRIVVGTDGRVEHVHVISAFADQARSISDALSQWQFRPYLEDGSPREIETGLLFDFQPDGVKTRVDVASVRKGN
ncbi:MAG: hypothetical protein JO065_18450 [Acidobacteria bacterium]|nr:hypothetical protein [Acidobacteriota bacterium]